MFVIQRLTIIANNEFSNLKEIVMGLFEKCLIVFVLSTIVIIVLFESVLYADMPLSSNILFGTFSALILSIFYGWMDDMFMGKRQPGLEE